MVKDQLKVPCVYTSYYWSEENKMIYVQKVDTLQHLFESNFFLHQPKATITNILTLKNKRDLITTARLHV